MLLYKHQVTSSPRYVQFPSYYILKVIGDSFITDVQTNKETIYSSCKEPLPAPDPDQYGKT